MKISNEDSYKKTNKEIQNKLWTNIQLLFKKIVKGVDITIMIIYFNFYAVARDALHYDPNFSVGRPTNH